MLETPQLFPVLWGLRTFYSLRGEHHTAREMGEKVLRLAQNAKDRTLLLEAHYALAAPLLTLGEFALAREHDEQGVALYDPQQHRSHALLYGQDPGVGCLAHRSMALWHLGYADQALKSSHDALTLAHERAHPYSLAFTLTFAAWIHQLRREEQTVRERAEATIALCSEHGFTMWLTVGTILRGWALAKQGQGEAGIVQMHRGLAALRAVGAEGLRPLWLTMLAEACEGTGQVEQGLNVLAEALTLVEKNGEWGAGAELYRLKGTLMLQSKTSLGPVSGRSQASQDQSRGPDPRPLTSDSQAEAEACFLKAIKIAQRQSAKSLELRAVMSLSRLWQKHGKKDEARQLLAEIYGWFTEGLDTKDLQEAKRLIEELS